MSDAAPPTDLSRFVSAQERVYPRVLAELRDGRKTTHWMWFIFPQIAGLGYSDMARLYAIGSIAEARAYLAHPVLGPRLFECTTLVNSHPGTPIGDIFGDVDAMKFRSSMTLFDAAAADSDAFAQALDMFCKGERDQATLSLL